MKPLAEAERKPFTLRVVTRMQLGSVRKWPGIVTAYAPMTASAATAAATPGESDAFRREFVDFAITTGVLRFGEFKTKAGRLSPYFFNAGLFTDGASLGELGRYYARAALASGIGFDMLFGPAYKGITLAAATAIGLAALGHNVPFCYNRKEAKDHGEGGTIVGGDRKSTRLNSSHSQISYAVFCLKKKKK